MFPFIIRRFGRLHTFRKEVKSYRNSGSKFWGSRFRVKLAKENFYCKANAKRYLFLLVAYADLHVSPEEVLCSPGGAQPWTV